MMSIPNSNQILTFFNVLPLFTTIQLLIKTLFVLGFGVESNVGQSRLVKCGLAKLMKHFYKKKIMKKHFKKSIKTFKNN